MNDYPCTFGIQIANDNDVDCKQDAKISPTQKLINPNEEHSDDKKVFIVDVKDESFSKSKRNEVNFERRLDSCNDVNYPVENDTSPTSTKDMIDVEGPFVDGNDAIDNLKNESSSTSEVVEMNAKGQVLLAIVSKTENTKPNESNV